MTGTPPPRPPRVLFVCTANRCRSPFAERLSALSPLANRFVFASAGLMPGGAGTPERGLRVAREYGIDLGGHRSRRLDRGLLEEQDLVIGMERAHAREAVAMSPQLWPRVFTLPQLDRWLTSRRRPAGQELREWLDAEAARRSRAELIGSDPRDEIADPVSSPQKAWRTMAADLSERLDRVLDRLA